MNNTTTNNTDDYWIDLVTLLNKTISQYGLGLIWLIGNIGSAFTCIVFSQPAFRNSPCAIYFIASSFSQFFTFNFALFTRMLEFGYNINAINIFLWYCKIRYYLFYMLVAIPRYNIILASIDRYFASSRDVRRRQWSSPKIAFRLAIGNIIFWSLMYTQFIIFYEIYNGSCQPQPGIYGIFFSIYISIDSGILPLSLMIIFGLLTINNIHQTKRHIRPNAAAVDGGRFVGTGRVSKKDAQLHKMLANQIILFLILNIFNPCVLVYRSLTLYTVKSPLRLTVELFINNMTYVLIYLGFALTCVNFIISSEMFRREFLKFIQTKIIRRQVTPTKTTTVSVKVVRKTDGPA
jgi:hypothetical protein